MQAAPEAHGAERLALGQGLMGEIDEELIRREIDVIEGDYFRDGLLENLRAPAGFAAGVEALAQDEAQFLPHAHEVLEVTARGAIGVVVVIGPTQAEAILAGFLHLSGAVFALPVFALGGEEQITGAINADLGDGGIQQAMGPGETDLVILELPIAAAEGLLVAQNGGGLMVRPWRNIKTGVTVPFEDDQLGFIVVKDFCGSKRGQRRTLNGFVGAFLPDHQKIGDGFDFDRGAKGAAVGEDDYRKDSLLLEEALVCAGEGGFGEAGGFELLL